MELEVKHIHASLSPHLHSSNPGLYGRNCVVNRRRLSDERIGPLNDVTNSASFIPVAVLAH